MKDTTKTAIFVAVALAAIGITWIGRPKFPVAQVEQMEGKELFPEFTDPLKAAEIQIVQYDEQTTATRPFEVAQVKGKWSIPSHANYPTDAKDQLASAAGGLLNLKVLQVVAQESGEHAEYGVLDPAEAKAGTKGIGTRVVIRDKDKKQLLGLIIGKQVPDRQGLYYVRQIGASKAYDPVYIVEARTDKLSTKFEDWIERNLLKINSWDMKGVHIEDYTVMIAGRDLGWMPKARLDLNYNETDPKWVLAKDEVFDAKKKDWQASKLAADEELDTAKLDALKTALDDLKIVDVAKKPAGLSGNLKASGEVKADREALASLQDRGFYLIPTEDGKSFDLFSNKGEVRILMKDGVQYVLRFGDIAGAGAEKTKPDEKKDAKDKKSDEPSGPGVNRYLFVMAEFNPDAIPKPQLETLPEEKTEPAKDGPAKTDAKDDGKDTKKDDTKDDAKDDTKADAKDDSKAEPKKDDAKKDSAADDKKTEAKKDDAKKPDMKAERERIEKENKRKQDEYDEKVKKGKEHVKELNTRFADWYYVISDDVYRKTHLTREQIVKKKDKTKPKEAGQDHTGHDHEGETKDSPIPGNPLGDLENLKTEGLESK